jgi:hypothetical protein
VRRICALVLFVSACGGSPVGSPATNTVQPSLAVATALPQSAVPTPPFASGTCTRPGIENINVIQRWLELAGRHDPAAVRDCFAASYGAVPDQIVDRWASLGGATASQISHSVNAIRNGCDFYGVSATFPNGNPYAPVQSATQMFFVVGVGADGDRPRIFGTATAGVNQSPDVTPHVGPPDCR